MSADILPIAGGGLAARRLGEGGGPQRGLRAISVADGLPALLARAAHRLLEARSSAEVLEAKAIAEAALHYAKVTRAANEAHADCIRVITRAEIRMAEELDRGRAEGDIAQAGDNQHTEVRQTLADLNIDHRRLGEWRKVRDAGVGRVEEAIQAALAEDKPPTLHSVHQYVRGGHVHGTEGTGEFERYTPAEYIASARSVLGAIDLDPASNAQAQRIVKAARYLTIEDDGLAHPWQGRVWLNPPYHRGLLPAFVDKLVEEVEAR
jgi:hypothetical protein